jgi:hypothetical protein
MRFAFAILVAVAPLSAQEARPTVVRLSSAVHTNSVRVSLASLATLSRSFDRNFQMFAPTDPIDVLGGTRGIYLQGFGTVFTTELDVIRTPQLSPFRSSTFSDEEKAKIRQRKQARIPDLEHLMHSMLQSAAKELAGMPDDEQIVVAVQLLYLPYEDSSGLPGQIMVKATRRTILSGVQIEPTVITQ